LLSFSSNELHFSEKFFMKILHEMIKM
jgi:hypothetical protein